MTPSTLWLTDGGAGRGVGGMGVAQVAGVDRGPGVPPAFALREIGVKESEAKGATPTPAVGSASRSPSRGTGTQAASSRMAASATSKPLTSRPRLVHPYLHPIVQTIG